MTTYYWTPGATDIFSNAAYWGGTLPADGSTAVVGLGTVAIPPGYTLPNNLTFQYNGQVQGMFATPTSVIATFGPFLPADLIILDPATNSGTLAGLAVQGAVTSFANIGVHRANQLDIAVMGGGSFTNMGAITINGTGKFGSGMVWVLAPDANPAAAASYGTVNVNSGTLFASVADTVASPPGQINVAGAGVALVSAYLQNTNVTFANSSTQAFGIIENIGGSLNGTGAGAFYAYGEVLSGFSLGDRLMLMSNAHVAQSLSVSGNVVTFHDGANGAGNALGSVATGGALSASQFYVSRYTMNPSDTPLGITAETDFTYGNLWASGVTGNFNDGLTYYWSDGVPTSGSVAIIRTGKVQINTATASPPSNVTFDMGVLRNDPTGSNLALTDVSANGAVLNDNINVTAIGGHADSIANWNNATSSLTTEIAAGVGVNGC